MLTSDQREEVAKHFNIVTGGKKRLLAFLYGWEYV